MPDRYPRRVRAALTLTAACDNLPVTIDEETGASDGPPIKERAPVAPSVEPVRARCGVCAGIHAYPSADARRLCTRGAA